MKKILIYTLSLALTVVGMTACAKSTKGKVTNTWKVTSMENVETSINSNGDKHVSTLSMNESSASEKDDYYPASGVTTSTTRTGTMNTNEMVIKKDGTWTWTTSVTYTGDNGNSTETEMVEQSGTWSFLAKSKGDNFKKNERILFNVLAAKLHEVDMENGVVTDEDTSDLVYSTGKNTMIYTVKESKKGELELESEAQNVTTQNSTSNSNSISSTIVMKSKE
ncbi:hypothetical protein [Fluviicola sp.]|uniref:hypothetical protein n=1 Tax=Fluviicola sp. TaxID=1917219 RepID=UPI0031D347CB